MSYREVLATPLRAFWTLNGQIARVRAEEQLHQIDLFILGNMGSGDMVKTLRDHLSNVVGTPAVFEKSQETVDAEDLAQHREGLNRLRALSGSLKKESTAPSDGDPEANA